MDDETQKAIRVILTVYDRWAQGSIIYKKAIAQAIEVLRSKLEEQEQKEAAIEKSGES